MYFFQIHPKVLSNENKMRLEQQYRHAKISRGLRYCEIFVQKFNFYCVVDFTSNTLHTMCA